MLACRGVGLSYQVFPACVIGRMGKIILQVLRVLLYIQ